MGIGDMLYTLGKVPTTPVVNLSMMQSIYVKLNKITNTLVDRCNNHLRIL